MALTTPRSKQHSLVSPASIHSPVDWEGRRDPLLGMVSFLQWKPPSKLPHRPTVWIHSMHTVKLVYAQRCVIPHHSPHQIFLRRHLPSKLLGKATLQVTSHQHSFLSVWSRFVCKHFQRGQSLIPWWWSEHQSCSEIRNWDRLMIGHGRLRLTNIHSQNGVICDDSHMQFRAARSRWTILLLARYSIPLAIWRHMSAIRLRAVIAWNEGSKW